MTCTHFPNYWPFVRGIHQSPTNSHHKRPMTRSFACGLRFCIVVKSPSSWNIHSRLFHWTWSKSCNCPHDTEDHRIVWPFVCASQRAMMMYVPWWNRGSTIIRNLGMKRHNSHWEYCAYAFCINLKGICGHLPNGNKLVRNIYYSRIILDKLLLAQNFLNGQ